MLEFLGAEPRRFRKMQASKGDVPDPFPGPMLEMVQTKEMVLKDASQTRGRKRATAANTDILISGNKKHHI
jgi:hypothetical protein